MTTVANPILARNDAFTTRSAQSSAPWGQPLPPQQWGTPQQWGQPQWGQTAPAVQFTDSMTLDDVITKTGLVMGVLIASAAVSYTMLDHVMALGAMVLSGLVGFVTVLLVSARKVISPALVIFYALVEGIFIGGFSRMFADAYDGIVQQAVLGTFAAAGVTLAAYRFLGIRVSDRMRRMVFLTTAAFAGVMLVNFVLSLLGFGAGLRGMGMIGFLAALVGAGLAVFNLVVDFDDIQRGIAGNAPARESWRAAFGLTVTMVWLYTEVLRLLSIVRR